MKTTNRFPKTLIPAGLLLGVSFGHSAFGHTQTGFLPAVAGVADYYQVSCGSGTATLEAKIKDVYTPPLTIEVGMGKQLLTAVDSVGGDSNYSPLISLSGGEGQYVVNVVKTNAKAANYTFEFHCINGPEHTDTNIARIENDFMPIDSHALPTTIRGEGTEGATLYATLHTADGCHQGGPIKVIPVIAQSVLFPTVDSAVTRSDTSDAIALDSVITNAAGLANLPQLIQNKSVYSSQTEKTSNGNVIGFVSSKGKLNTTLGGATPFQMNAIQFKPESCAKRLLIKLAVAEICKPIFPPKPGTANLWIPATTPTFGNADVDGIGDPPTLIINRNLAANPIDAGNCGEGFDAIIEPSATDIDANLPMPKFWSR